MSKAAQALRMIAEEGISATDAAKRLGISPQAVSKAKRRPSRIQSLEAELRQLKQLTRCPSCNHEFPHHWSGCGEIKGDAA